MEYTQLGNTGLEVSKLCLGCAALSHTDGGAWTLNDEEASLAIIDRALDHGINFIDTANIYSRGESEEVVGRAIQGRRDEVVLTSKVGKTMSDGPNGSGLSRRHVIEQAHASLDRLDTDYIDLYQIHAWDYRTPIEETLDALDQLIDEGKVRYVGASNLASWQLMKALGASDREGFRRFASIQPEYNLVVRHEEENLIPVASDQPLGVITYAPLAAGFLTGEYERSSEPAELDASDDTYRDLSYLATESRWEVLDEVRSIAEREDVTPVQVSVAWLLHKDIVDAPIIGPRETDHVDEYVGALEVDLSESDLERLEDPIDPTWDRSKLNL
ncbi:aldo/keto reductase [Halosimplex amylolyticum]|uniref:aldo/keto reductase n=1 Tax=Halosimplex amylolyticum TaxID=3396616 RepID=UPI003F56C63A